MMFWPSNVEVGDDRGDSGGVVGPGGLLCRGP